MISVTNNYKSAIVKPRHIDAKIIVGGSTITSDNINSISRSFNSDLFKTISKVVNIDSNTTIAKDTTINPQFGLYVNNAFEYISLGSYKTINAPILNKDTSSYQITAYDKIVESMVSYELTSVDITFPCTVRELFVAIFTKLNWAVTGIPATFTNSTSSIDEDVFSNVNMTYRDVLDELCTISCMFLLDVNGVPTLKQLTTTGATINEDYMCDVNVNVGNQVFFNSLVFARASDSDNIYRKDDTSIGNYGLHEFRVSNLQILSLNWRDNFIDAMWNYIKTFTYYAFEINTNGITYLEPIDEFTLSIFGDTYSTLLLNSDLTIGGGLNEKIYSNEPLETETEYKYADTTDKRLNQTTLTVDKQNQQIEALVSATKIISNDLTGTGSVQLQNAYSGTLHHMSIKGDIHLITPSETLYPSNTLYPKDTYLLVDSDKVKLDIDYLNYISDSVCDEFIYEEGKCKIIRRVGVDANNNLYELVEETEEDRNDAIINVQTNSTISMEQFNNVKFEITYLLENEYTDNFAPTIDLISKINLSEGSAMINANKINLEGETIDLTSKRIKIQSTNFNVDEEGNMTCMKGTFGGDLKTEKDCIVGNNLIIGVNQSQDASDYKKISLSNTAYIERLLSGDYSLLNMRGDAIQLFVDGETPNSNHPLLVADYYDAVLSTENQHLGLHNGYIGCSSTPIVDSDKRLKQDIKDTKVDWIDELKVKEFEYIKSPNQKQIGLIAQDYIDKGYSKYFLIKKEDGYYGISYGNIQSALIQYCQQLNKKIEKLEERIKKMESDK